jgi:hypothetical protein
MSDRNDKRRTINKAGLAALVLLAPGGFILGFTLAARHYRKKKAAADRPERHVPAEREAGGAGGNNRTS